MQMQMSKSAVLARTTARQPLRVVARAAIKDLKKVAKTAKGTPSENKDKVGFKVGFSKTNELLVGRAAMLGFASALVGEILTGKGILSQLGYELEINNLKIEEYIVLAVVLVPPILAAVLPKSQKFVPEDDLEGRKPGALQDPRISLASNPKQFLGITRFGWTKANELFVGRVAQLGFAAAVIGEVLTGKGPLAQFDFETGIPLRDTEFGLLAFILFILAAAIGNGSGKFVDVDDIEA